MNSAETINKGNFKVMAHPMVVFGKGRADNETGIVVAGGYGFTDRFDIEARASFFDRVTFLGVDAEYWLVKGQPVNMSIVGGVHIDRTDGPDGTGLDLTWLVSGDIANRLELYGALDFSRVSVDRANFSYNTLHLVPGLEYKVSPRMDVVTEFGIALNDNSSHYFTVGIALYTRGR